MRRVGGTALAFALSASSCLLTATAQTTSGPSGAPPASVGAPSAVAEQASLALRQMATYVGSAEQFTFHADITFDHVLPSGQKVQFSASEEVALQRPGRLYVAWSGDLGDRQFWYDGKSVTLYDPATPFYASEPAPAEIDAMLDKLLPQLNFSPPLADLMYSDPYQQVRGNILMVSIWGQMRSIAEAAVHLPLSKKMWTGRSGSTPDQNWSHASW